MTLPIIVSASSDEAVATAELVNVTLWTRAESKMNQLTWTERCDYLEKAGVMKPGSVATNDLRVKKLDLLTPEDAFRRPEYMPRVNDTPNPQALATLLNEKVNEQAKPDDPRNTILVVGHQPLLGWMSHAHKHKAYPIARSEIVCIDLEDQNRESPRWVISPSDPEVVKDLREKIKSKMTVANLLSAFIGAGLSFLLATFSDRGKTEYMAPLLPVAMLGAGLFLVALVMFLSTMIPTTRSSCRGNSGVSPRSEAAAVRTGW